MVKYSGATTDYYYLLEIITRFLSAFGKRNTCLFQKLLFLWYDLPTGQKIVIAPCPKALTNDKYYKVQYPMGLSFFFLCDSGCVDLHQPHNLPGHLQKH
ncbi:MAG: hypothetical protein C5B59_09700 [Bacteroidetes bacterium]|nr:MAG: hypothetical protein C5B59_09700 [Bacteroidota bacterium]